MMEWDKHERPPVGVCPQEYCFHWVVPGGMTSPPGRKYKSTLEAFQDSKNWLAWPEGGCACEKGCCTRLDPVNGDRDYYEAHDLRLEAAGLPWFYFNTLENLRADYHERFLRESQELWGPTDSPG
jgi:hypothetical protein